MRFILMLVSCASFLFSTRLNAQGGPCFPPELTTPWTSGDTDADTPGAARPLPETIDGDYELCSATGGFGKETDSFRYVMQKADGDFTLTARLDSIEAFGAAGLMARTFMRDKSSAYVRVTVHRRLGSYFVRSLVRTEQDEIASALDTKMPEVDLPILLRIEREGGTVRTYYEDASGTLSEHLSSQVGNGGLNAEQLQTGMVQTSEDRSRPANAVFSRPSLNVRAKQAPSIDCFEGFILANDGDAEITLRGSFLDQVRSVLVAGVPARIIDQSPEFLTILSGANPDGLTAKRFGDIVLESEHHRSVLERAAVYAGRNYLRGDANLDGNVDVSDSIFLLRNLFAGGPPALCTEAADTNNDDSRDISDAVFLLLHLFAGEGRIAEPYPNPGLPEGASAICGMTTAPGLGGIFSRSGTQLPDRATLRENDIIELDVRHVDSLDDLEVFFGDVATEILESSTEDRLVLRILEVPTPGPKCPVFFDAFSGPEDRRDDRLPGRKRSALGEAWLLDPAGLLPEECPNFFASPQTDTVVTTRWDASRGVTLVEIDEARWNPESEISMQFRIWAPLLHRGSRGSRVIEFNFHYSPSPDFRGSRDEWFSIWTDALAARLNTELHVASHDDCADPCDLVAEGLQPGQVGVSPCEGGLSVNIPPIDSGNVPGITDLKPPKLSMIGGTGITKPVLGCPGDPGVLEDYRKLAWCRLEEIAEPDGNSGLPKWEHFIPMSAVLGDADAADELPHPSARQLSDKATMYNVPAYEHVRYTTSYHLPCVPVLNVARCFGLGFKRWMPSFPPSARIIKAFWAKRDHLPASIDEDSLYSYKPANQARRYLVGMHLNLKVPDRPDWLWATFFLAPLQGETLNKAGDSLTAEHFNPSCKTGHRSDAPDGMPAWLDRFVLCIDDEGPANNKCGNPWGPWNECQGQTCRECHTSAAQMSFTDLLDNPSEYHQFEWMVELKNSAAPMRNECWDSIIDEITTPWDEHLMEGCDL